MIKGFLKRRQGETPSAVIESEAFDITRVRFPGRSIIAFEKRGGQAAALEVTDRGAEILRGLAAGAVLSELDDVMHSDPAGLTEALSRDEGATREETAAFIQSLDLLDGSEKKALLGAVLR